jgi:catechol 2,3-dioxygenase-like lactoylglutathione lyase family enzyme
MPLDHVALTVRDHERSAAFYGEHFGLTDRVHDDEHLLILSDGEGSLLALFEGEPAAEALPRTNHFGFRLPHADDVLAARERFARAGVDEIEFQPSGPTRVQVTDPDGYRVEVYAF